MLNILVVEDEAPIRDWIVYTISKISEEYNLLDSTCNGKEALEVVMNNKIDIIFSDIKMPIMDGIELTKEIKKFNKDIYIVLLTNYAEFSYAKEAISCGVYEYLIKSDIRPKELKETLNKIEEDIKAKDKNLIIDKEIYIKENVDTDKKYPKAINMAIKYINSNYKESISLCDISKKVFLSHEYFSRLFKEEVGDNFSTYLSNFRMKKAEHLIKNTDMRINEIASEVGYQNPSYFSKSYKKYKGVSPDDDRY